MSGDSPGASDLQLFTQGRHRRLWELLGGRLRSGGGAGFSVWAPNALGVAVRGDWDDWTTDTPMEISGASGVWATQIPTAHEGQRYAFAVRSQRGTVLKADPMALRADVPPGIASVLEHSHHVWSETMEEFRIARQRRGDGRCSIYEVHLGSWRHHPGSEPWSARDLVDALPDWVALHGFTHVEFLPVATHPFGGSWGYQVSGYYAPDARLGSPDDLRHLIQAFHERDIGVILDWVPAHFPRDEFALAEFDGSALYEHGDSRRADHPDWGTLVFDHDRAEVRNFLLANALYWLEEFRVDGLRVDAVASMIYRDYSRDEGEWVPNEFGGREDLGAVSFLQELNAAVAQDHTGAWMIAEESTAWPKVTGAVDDGGLGFSHKWNLGWMHDTLGYFAQDPVHRAHHRDELTFPMVYAPHERWVLPFSHDEVVHEKGSLLNKQCGDAWQRMANLRTMLAWQWCHPGRQLVFMGTELAQEREWSNERELDWFLLEDPAHEGVRRLVKDLNNLQVEYPELWRGDDATDSTFGWLDPNDTDRCTVAFWRREPISVHLDDDLSTLDATVLVVANFTPLARPAQRVPAPPGHWRCVLDTDHPDYGGSGFAPPTVSHVTEASLLIDLPPLALTVWVRTVPSSLWNP